MQLPLIGAGGGREKTPEETVRWVIDACADCDTCRFLMDESCLVFPELYRLHDMEAERRGCIEKENLRQLAELCTYCGLCPCPDIRNALVRAKTGFVSRDGIISRLGNFIRSDVRGVGRAGAMFPAAYNAAIRFGPMRRLAGKLADIHPRRRIPRFPGETFFSWSAKQGFHRLPKGSGRKVAYFAGCTAGYLFPEVARAAIRVLVQRGDSVYVPPQQCCGMPFFLDGERSAALGRMQFNLRHLLEAREMGCKLVTSCPTCGYAMKNLLKEGAFYSADYQRSISAASDEIIVPQGGGRPAMSLKKDIYHRIFRDTGYFSPLDPLKRIALAESILDLGEYLAREGPPHMGSAHKARMVYYPPCHQREQGIGRPYEELLSHVDGLVLITVGNDMDCCGMGGNLGFRTGFHEKSLALGRPLFQKIEAAAPEAIITDCLSCRLQFGHALSRPVFHPLEMIA